MRKYQARWFAFAVTATRPEPRAFAYAAIAPCHGGGWRAELAGHAQPATWDGFAADLLRVPHAAEPQLLAYRDPATGQFRFAAFADGACVGLLFVGPKPVAVSRTWAISQFSADICDGDRLRLLAGRAGTNCGSCRAEIGRLIDAFVLAKAG